MPRVHLQHLSHAAALADVSDPTLRGKGGGREGSEEGRERVELRVCVPGFSQISELLNLNIQVTMPQHIVTVQYVIIDFISLKANNKAVL